MAQSPLQLAVLISGSGTTLQNLIDCIARQELNAAIVVVVASRDGIAGIDRARAAGLRCEIVQRSRFFSPEEFSQGVFRVCEQAGAELLCLGGWLSYLHVPPRLIGKIMNIHPALLPSFGGSGMYGQRVHQAVLDHGCKIAGCTVHFVDHQYDTGPIILQRACPVLEDDTPQTLAHRVFEEEKIAYPQAISLYQQGRLRLDGRRVRVV